MTDAGGVLRDFGIPWPTANEDELREAATIWRGLAKSIRDNYQHANNACVSLTSNNVGGAIDAFEEYWRKFGDPTGVLPRAAEACDTMSAACTKYANEVEEKKRRLEELGAELGATVTVGTFGAIFTFGISEGVADGLAAGILSTADSAMTGLAAMADGLVTTLSAGAVDDALQAAAAAFGRRLITQGAAKALGAGVVAAGNGAIGGVSGAVLAFNTDNWIRSLFGDEPLGPVEAGEALGDGAWTGAFGGVLGKLGDMGQTQLVALLKNSAISIGEIDPQLSLQMQELARQVEGTPGKVATEVVAKAANQLVAAQQINAGKLVEGEVQKLLARRITKGAT